MTEPTRDEIAQAYARALAIIDELRTSRAALLTSCKELREALAGAMRVIAEHDADSDELTEAFVAEMTRLEIAPGVGLRADDVIAQAEGRPPRPRVGEEITLVEPDPRD